MSKVVIEYGDYADGAKEAFVPSASEAEDFSNINQISTQGLVYPNYSNPIELYSVMLDGGAVALPSDTDDKNVGLWSKQISDDGGVFETQIVLTLIADELYSSSGISFEFDAANGIYPTQTNIKWYRDDELLADKDYTPNNANYFFANQVEYYNKVIISFSALNMPYNRLKVRSVEFGRRIEFAGYDLKVLSLAQKTNPISAELAISTSDFTIATDKQQDFYFQERQPLTILFDNNLQAKVFVKSAKRKAKSVWSVKAEDYIGIMDSVQFYGGIYSNKAATELLGEIFATAKVPYEIDEALSGETVTGYIPITSCRGALMQVLFAIGAVAITAKTDVVKVGVLPTEENQVVELNRILQGQSFEEDTKVTAVSVTVHSYKQIEDTVTAYDAVESGIGDNIIVQFNEPLHSLTISNGALVEFGANYAIINAEESCALVGKRYEHSTEVKTKKNPLVSATQSENVKTVSRATLISKRNIDNVLNKCYNYYVENKIARMKIVEGETPTTIGDKIEVETEYIGNITGVITSQQYNLSGNTIVKDTIIRM